MNSNNINNHYANRNTEEPGAAPMPNGERPDPIYIMNQSFYLPMGPDPRGFMVAVPVNIMSFQNADTTPSAQFQNEPNPGHNTQPSGLEQGREYRFDAPIHPPQAQGSTNSESYIDRWLRTTAVGSSASIPPEVSDHNHNAVPQLNASYDGNLTFPDEGSGIVGRDPTATVTSNVQNYDLRAGSHPDRTWTWTERVLSYPQFTSDTVFVETEMTLLNLPPSITNNLGPPDVEFFDGSSSATEVFENEDVPVLYEKVQDHWRPVNLANCCLVSRGGRKFESYINEEELMFDYLERLQSARVNRSRNIRMGATGRNQ